MWLISQFCNHLDHSPLRRKCGPAKGAWGPKCSPPNANVLQPRLASADYRQQLVAQATDFDAATTRLQVHLNDARRDLNVTSTQLTSTLAERDGLASENTDLRGGLPQLSTDSRPSYKQQHLHQPLPPMTSLFQPSIWLPLTRLFLKTPSLYHHHRRPTTLLLRWSLKTDPLLPCQTYPPRLRYQRDHPIGIALPDLDSWDSLASR